MLEKKVYLNMKSIGLLFLFCFSFCLTIAKPTQPHYPKDTVKKGKNLTYWFKIKKGKKLKKIQNKDCWICEPLNYVSDTMRKVYTPRYDDPCSRFVWLLILPIIILVTAIVAIYAGIIIGSILLLGSAILFGLYVLLLLSMGVALVGWYIWGGIIGAFIIFTAFYFIFCLYKAN